MTEPALIHPADALLAFWKAMDRNRQPLQAEEVPLSDAYRRVLASDTPSPGPIPEFRRSMVDGYAARAADTGARRRLRVAGEVAMGALSPSPLASGTAVKIHTGGHVPDGADCVLMVERVALSGASIELTEALAPGDNVIEAGEDVAAGAVVLRAGKVIREQEIAGLASLGHPTARVRRRPRVALISSGDELVPVDSPVRPGQVRGSNGPMLAALVRANGGEPVDFGILPDDREAFAAAARRATDTCDVVVFIAGSSASDRDFTPETIAALGKPGILARGIAFRPGKPTLFAVCDSVPVLGLPGNPNSALTTARRFLAPTLWRLLGAPAPPPRRAPATLAEAVRSPVALEHWIPCSLEASDGRLLAHPIPTKSNLIFSFVRADGLLCSPIGSAGHPAGAAVEVEYFDA